MGKKKNTDSNQKISEENIAEDIKLDNNHDNKSPEDSSRRDFMVLTASGVAAVGGMCAVYPFVDSLNPSSDVLALATVEIDISDIQEGQSKTFKWRGKPIFIRHRTQEEIDEANKANLSSLKDPEPDSNRVKSGNEKWLILVGICTHLGCVPIGDYQGSSGWFCPCHGSHYDTSGRIVSGPAPKNMEVPEYSFISDTKIRIG